MSFNPPKPSDAVQVVDEDALSDVDEPPDDALLFRRQPIRTPTSNGSLRTLNSLAADEKPRQQSLLTQGLLTITAPKAAQSEHLPGPRSARSTYSNGSLASTAELTSDGFTSPARTSTPSPPLPPTTVNLLNIDGALAKNINSEQSAKQTLAAPPEKSAEQPRKRCITFACARPTPAKNEAPRPAEPAAPGERRTTLKFACPAKPAHKPTEDRDRTPSRVSKSPPSAKDGNETPKFSGPAEKDETPKKAITGKPPASHSPTLKKKEREALRFHAFASPRLVEEEWTREKPVRHRKLTVNDTLKKENAIRKLGEEVEAEEEEEDEDNEGFESGNNEENDEIDDDLELSDGGNETDDEEGFAASDDESDNDSAYQFWTPGLTTAATSADEVGHIRPNKRRSASESSIESIVNTNSNAGAPVPVSKGRTSRRKSQPKMRPSTPELPDSTDFVCGTLDEDRPLEAAYLSCLEQRKMSKHGITPQDLDPSFPTSDPEQEDSDDEDQGVDSESQAWVAGKFDESDDPFRGRPGPLGRNTRSPSISPKRKASPAPKRRKSPAPLLNKRGDCRSPPPRRLFGQSPKRLHSPPPPRNLASPPNSRKPSYDGSSIAVPYLAQRPNLTHTKSLPRTPNPFWQRLQMKDSKHMPVGHDKIDAVPRRGPIDIVKGLEKKRQRRKEKYLLTHCRNGNHKDHRRCQPGKGAQRMREVGLEMADRCRGYGQRLQVVLSM